MNDAISPSFSIANRPKRNMTNRKEFPTIGLSSQEEKYLNQAIKSSLLPLSERKRTKACLRGANGCLPGTSTRSPIFSQSPSSTPLLTTTNETISPTNSSRSYIILPPPASTPSSTSNEVKISTTQRNRMIENKKRALKLRDESRSNAKPHISGTSDHASTSSLTTPDIIQSFTNPFTCQTLIPQNDSIIDIYEGLPNFSETTSRNFIWEDSPCATAEEEINAAYDEVVFWRKNVFKLPSGSVGKTFIDETSRLLGAYTSGNPLERIALKAVSLMTPLLLQKPYRNSVTKDNTNHLQCHMSLWQQGKFHDLMREGRVIQQRLQSSRTRLTIEDTTRIFSKLMFQGKTKSALRLLSDQNKCEVLPLTEESRRVLIEKHPPAEPAHLSVLIKGPLQVQNPIIFAEITRETIRKAAIMTQGSAGPSGGDADHWKRM